MTTRRKRKHRRGRRPGRITRLRTDMRAGRAISIGVWRLYRGRLPWRSAAHR